MLVTAINVGKKLKLKDLAKKFEGKRVSKEPFIIESERGKYITLLKYGVLVFWGHTQESIKNKLNRLLPFIESPLPEPNRELAQIKESSSGNRITSKKIQIKEISLPYIAVISLVMGRSVALEYYEKELEQALKDLEYTTSVFAEKGKSPFATRHLIRKAGASLYVQQQLMTDLALLDKPDITWDSPDLDAFYGDLIWEYELEDRFFTLGKKNEVITRTVEFILDYINSRHSFWLEVIIISLILFEIIIFVFEIWKG